MVRGAQLAKRRGCVHVGEDTGRIHRDLKHLRRVARHEHLGTHVSREGADLWEQIYGPKHGVASFPFPGRFGVALIQFNQLFRERGAGGGSRNPLRKLAETGEGLVSHLDSLGSVREAVEFLEHWSIKFDDGETDARGLGSTIWKPRDPFKSDTPAHWLSIPIENATEELRDAVWGFVRRHQKEKLEKHIRRGNLNGLPNFLDIFRTLNGLLLAFNRRKLENDLPVIPHPYVTEGMKRNLKLLIGSFRPDEDQDFGFVASIRANLGGDQQIIQERLRREHVPEMIQAAVGSMIEVRKSARKLPGDDSWALARRDWISGWITESGLDVPSDEDVNSAKREYGCIGIAA